jgi:hypothetical protein
MGSCFLATWAAAETSQLGIATWVCGIAIILIFWYATKEDGDE